MGDLGTYVWGFRGNMHKTTSQHRHQPIVQLLSSCCHHRSAAFDPGACGYSGIGPLVNCSLVHVCFLAAIIAIIDHDAVAFDPGACGHSGIGPLANCSLVHVCLLAAMIAIIGQWPLIPKPAGIRASVHQSIARPRLFSCCQHCHH